MHNSIHYKYSAFLSVTKYLISGMCFILILFVCLFSWFSWKKVKDSSKLPSIAKQN